MSYEYELNELAKEQGKEVRFFKMIKSYEFCRGCGKFDVAHYANNLCRSCYANWMRQKRTWKDRKEKEDAENGTYRDKALKVYGGNIHCNKCGVRQFLFPIKPYLSDGSPNYVTKIHIHHVDGDRKNSSISNLEPLCAQCHKRGHIKRKNKLSTV